MRTRTPHALLCARLVTWALLLQMPVLAQDLNLLRQFGTTNPDRGWAVTAGSSGIYVAGDTNTAASGWDVFLAKYDAAGNPVWTRQFGTAATEDVRGIAADSTGVYVVGSTGGVLTGLNSAGGTDAYIRKYDFDGNVLWTRQFGSPGTDKAYAVAAFGGAVYVAGSTTGSGSLDAFVSKYDSFGNLAWTREFGSASSDEAWAVAADATGVYVAGYTYGSLPGQTALGGGDAFLRKYGADGVEGWTRQFGTASFDLATGVAATGGIYVSGVTLGTVSGQASAGGQDALLIKFDESGSLVWARQFGTAGADWGWSVSADAAGAATSGYTYGTFPGQSSAGGADVFVRRYDTAGTELWTRMLGSSSNDEGIALNVFSDGIFVAGVTGGSLPGQVSAGGSDAFVAKFGTGAPPPPPTPSPAPPPPPPLPPAAPSVQTLIGLVNGLRAPAGPLNNGQARSLITKLEHVARELEQNDSKVACNVLNAFLNEVNALAAGKVLTSAQAGTLQTEAVALLKLLGCA